MKKFTFIYLLTVIIIALACKDTYKGPYPAEPTCFEYTATDTLEQINGVVMKKDSSFYISTYVDETTSTQYYPCAIALNYKKEGAALVYSGFLRNKEGDNKQYIELTSSQPILNETIITNYIGFVRNRDSTSININERIGSIKNSKIENYKLKLLINYNGCVKGRKYYITLYKTVQSGGTTKSYGYLTAPYENCSNPFLLWYDIDVSSYKKSTFYIYDGTKTHQFDIPE